MSDETKQTQEVKAKRTAFAFGGTSQLDGKYFNQNIAIMRAIQRTL